MCTSPITIKNPAVSRYSPSWQLSSHVVVPCGKCPECRARVQNDWAIRLYEESKTWKYYSFLTLTYDEGHCPKSASGARSLRWEDVRKVFHNLRSTYGFTFKYFCCSEYGSHTLRPHYHCCLFYDDLKFIDEIYKLWDKGHIFGLMSNGLRFIPTNAGSNPDVFKTVKYTAKYSTKPQDFKSNLSSDVEPPKRYMSKNLGLNYLAFNTAIDSVLRKHTAGERLSAADYDLLTTYTYFFNGEYKKTCLPRYFSRKLFETSTTKNSNVMVSASPVGFEKMVHRVSRKNGLGLLMSRSLQRHTDSRMLHSYLAESEDKDINSPSFARAVSKIETAAALSNKVRESESKERERLVLDRDKF